MENDKAAILSLKLTDRIPVREIEIDTEAQNPNSELNVLFDIDNFDDEANNAELHVLKNSEFMKIIKRNKIIHQSQKYKGY